MKKTINLALIAAPLLVASGLAHAEFSTNFGVTSNYIWRGVTQSGNAPSVSGGLDYSNANGFYAGTWIGSIDWGDGYGNGYENDLYLGYTGSSGGFGYDVGYIFYNYPQTSYDNSNFGEAYFNGSFGNFAFGVAYTTNSDAPNDAVFGQGDIYYHAGYTFELTDGYGLGVTVGHYAFDVPNSSQVDYSHVQVDLTKGDFTFSLSKATSDSGDDDTKLFASWSKSF